MKVLKIKFQKKSFLLALILLSLFANISCASQNTLGQSSKTTPVAMPETAPEAIAMDVPEANSQTSIKIPQAVYKGEPFLIEIAAPDLERAELFWQEKKLQIKAEEVNGLPQITSILAVGLQNKNESQNLKIILHSKKGSQEIKQKISLLKKEYPIQRLNVAPKYVSPPASMRKKIEEDRIEMRGVLSKLSSEKKWNLLFIRPVPGIVTSEYGLRREFNGKKRNPHRGLDLDGNLGDPILAAERGTVVLASKHYYGGNTLVLDHGLGVFTIYLHMNSFAVNQGQEIQRGDMLGEVGKTGRVTGPHLHFSLSVMGESVNPSPLLKDYPDTQKDYPDIQRKI